MQNLPKITEVKKIDILLGVAECPYCDKLSMLHNIRFKNGTTGEICPACAEKLLGHKLMTVWL